jgi:hypothetical protein
MSYRHGRCGCKRARTRAQTIFAKGAAEHGIDADRLEGFHNLMQREALQISWPQRPAASLQPDPVTSAQPGMSSTSDL